MVRGVRVECKAPTFRIEGRHDEICERRTEDEVVGNTSTTTLSTFET